MRNDTRFYLVATITIAFHLNVFASGAEAKTLPAPAVKPVTRGGIKYAVDVEALKSTCPEKPAGCGERVFLTAKNKKTREQAWKTELYQTVFDQALKTDVQSIRPKSLKFNSKTTIELIDQAKTRYVVKIADGQRQTPKETKVYSGP